MKNLNGSRMYKKGRHFAKRQRQFAQVYGYLWRCNPPLTCLWLMWLNLLGVRCVLRLNFGPAALWIRSATPDLLVAQQSFGGEYTTALAAVGPNPQLIIDAGGYIGSSALVFAQRFPQAKVVVLEPDPDNYQLLKRNVAAYPQIKVILAALSDREGYAALHDRQTGAWGYSIVPSSVADAGYRRYTPRTLTTPTLIEDYGAGQIDLLKLDIEGAERDVLAHSTDWLSKVQVLTVELHDHIAAGATTAYTRATAGRQEIAVVGEKRVSVILRR